MQIVLTSVLGLGLAALGYRLVGLSGSDQLPRHQLGPEILARVNYLVSGVVVTLVGLVVAVVAVVRLVT